MVSLGLILSSCAGLVGKVIKDPEVKVSGLSLESLSASDATVNVKINVKNPNGFGISVGKVKYNLNLSGKEVTQGTFAKGAEIPANGETDVAIPVTFKYDALNEIFNSIKKKTLSRKYTLTGSVDIGPLSIPFKEDGELEWK